ncbi:hypothetical protein [Subtercola sp. Z020]|uniref:hypothetical protein n=1 Tax=Subtercola sp. Z020 TaxID=2080582 RepID=UPI0011B042CA|nr:hypothetical protein [Subtercola sp. Z020]
MTVEEVRLDQLIIAPEDVIEGDLRDARLAFRIEARVAVDSSNMDALRRSRAIWNATLCALPTFLIDSAT